MRVNHRAGAGSGIGRQIALRLAEHGARLVLWDVDAVRNEQTRNDIVERGGEAHAYVCDVSCYKAVAVCAADVGRAVGRVDLLVNNAGIATTTRHVDTDPGARFSAGRKTKIVLGIVTQQSLSRRC